LPVTADVNVWAREKARDLSPLGLAAAQLGTGSALPPSPQFFNRHFPDAKMLLELVLTSV
jgi:hypothetical protein